MRKIIYGAVGAAVMIVAALSAYRYVEYYRLKPQTDDAYVRADIIRIAPQVSGPIVRIEICDNQDVKAGDLLFEIDPAPFKAEVASAKAKLVQAEAELAKMNQMVHAAEKQVKATEATLDLKNAEFRRATMLIEKQAISQQEFDVHKAEHEVAIDQMEKSKADLEQAKADRGSPGLNNYRIRVAQANLDLAKLKLGYTAVVAPADGFVTNLNLPAGNYLSEGKQILAIVKARSWFIYANFKESQLGRIRAGQKASISLPAYPDRILHGVVDGIARGILPQDYEESGLLPKIDPTVDWVRLAQRFPVRIALSDQTLDIPWRVGLSATVQVDTTMPAVDQSSKKTSRKSILVR